MPEPRRRRPRNESRGWGDEPTHDRRRLGWAECPAVLDHATVFFPGQSVALSADGFLPGATVSWRFYTKNSGGVLLTTATADASGHVAATATLPASAVPGGLYGVEGIGTGTAGAMHLAVALLLMGSVPGVDSDGDGVPDACDNCPSVSNAAQADGDGDGVGDVCDICADDPENDADGDGLCPGVDLCPYDPANDVDQDGRCSYVDNCPTTYNPGQEDGDRDGVGDACDAGSSAADFYTGTPCRVLDTRELGGPTLGAPLSCGTERKFAVAGKCGVPSSAKAVSLNLTGTGSTAQGNLRLFAAGTPAPLVSNLNYTAGQTRANNAVAPLGDGGQISVLCAPSGTTHVVLDVNGYFQ